MATGFDNELYTKLQTEKILERIETFNNKLYLEFGGKIFDDLHAARVLPGFIADAKINILTKLKDKTEIVFVISAKDIEKNKVRADYGITYGMDVLRLIDKIRALGLYVSSIVITQYDNQPNAELFVNKLKMRGEKTYIHFPTKGYPTDVDTIVSDEGYGKNPYIETSRPLVVVTAPGPGSGKLATCLSQLYHEYKRGVKAGYAKFETFPIWNLPLRHPVNVAYESATADLGDINMIDPYHLEAYNIATVNYNRDIECFPIVKSIITKITGNEQLYRSPTDMGVNMVGYAITDDNICMTAGRQEIIRRYYQAACDYRKGNCPIEVPQRIQLLMNENKIEHTERKVIAAAMEKEVKSGENAVAIELADGTIVSGRKTNLLSASASAVLNAIKYLAGIEDKFLLLSPSLLEPVIRLKSEILRDEEVRLNLYDVLTTLSISATTNPIALEAYNRLSELRGTQAHSSVILSDGDTKRLRKLGINTTCQPEFESANLFNN